MVTFNLYIAMDCCTLAVGLRSDLIGFALGFFSQITRTLECLQCLFSPLKVIVRERECLYTLISVICDLCGGFYCFHLFLHSANIPRKLFHVLLLQGELFLR